MSEVYRARNTKLGHDVALRVLPEHVAKDCIAPDSRLLLNQAIPDVTDDRSRKIFPQTIRVISIGTLKSADCWTRNARVFRPHRNFFRRIEH